VFLILAWLFEAYLDYRQYKRYKTVKTVPSELAEVISLEKFLKSQDYGREKL
jgi:hypothetical protein